MVDNRHEMTDNDGMSATNADISVAHNAPKSPLERLREAGLGAFFRPSQLAHVGLTPDNLKALIRQGAVEQTSRGLYRLAEAEITENYSLAMACARVPNSVVCLLSALRVHGIGTQAPAEVWLGIPHKARRPHIEDLRLRIVHFTGPAWTYGVESTEFEGVPGKMTSPARTIVDCFRFERLIGAEAAMEAAIDGLRQKLVTVGELARVEEFLPSRRLRAALDTRLI